MEDADIDGPVGVMKGVLGEWSAIVEANGSGAEGADAARGGVMWCCPLGVEKEEEWLEVGTIVAVWREGVGGPDELGDTGSVSHIRCDFVATSLATVCARVESGVTWKTGKESFPSIMPRVDRMTVIKWMQVLRSRGREEDLVSNLTSTFEMFPTTLWL